MSILKENVQDLNQRIAERVRQLRATASLSLDALAAKSGVSRSMISVIERGETSPTAVVLERLAAGLGVTLASFFDLPSANEIPKEPISRRADQPQWQDPSTGYVRRNVSPSHVPQPMQIVEVHFPPKERVAFETNGRDSDFYQQIWVLEGTIEITIGDERHRLRQGDCLAMTLNEPTIFHNPMSKAARYVVVISTEWNSKGRR